MKNSMKYILNLLIAIGLISTVSCSKDFLNQEPLDAIPSEQIWKDPALASAFVTEIYNGLGQGGFDEQMLASLSDEAVFTHTGRNINTINEGSLSPTNLGWVSGTYAYASMYQRIRACNLTIENLTSATTEITDENTNAMLLGQAYFLRAYFYHQLVRYYGGVPLITRDYKLNDSFAVARSSFADCVDFIVKDCDSAATLLEGKTMSKGQATNIAALALKSRILLYAASDLHVAANLEKLSDFADNDPNYNIDQLAYTSGSQQERWKKAKAAALEVINKGGSGYKLNLSAPVSAADGTANYISISMGGGSKAPGVDASAESELLFARYFVPSKDEGGEYIGKYNGPNGYHNWSGNTPIGLLVDDYEMADGSKFQWTGEEKAHPYKDRDPRFYATILYDGAPWKPRDKISGDVDTANQIQTGSYDLIDSKGNKIVFAGLDTRSSSIEDWNGSRTGYYMRKFIDPDPNQIDANDKQVVPWPFFRYTEAVLNYVEACLETGDEDNAKLWLNRIRYRAGMPAIKATGAALMDEYRNERRIELAYEEHRYHDARRWMIAPTTLGRKITFIKITGKFKPGKSLQSKYYHHDETIYDYTYTPVVDNAHENRTWLNKMYFRPFSRDEINKNPLLGQNPGYTN